MVKFKLKNKNKNDNKHTYEYFPEGDFQKKQEPLLSIQQQNLFGLKSSGRGFWQNTISANL